MFVSSGAAPPPVPPRRKVIKASMGNRGRIYRGDCGAKQVPVTLILIMFAGKAGPIELYFKVVVRSS